MSQPSPEAEFAAAKETLLHVLTIEEESKLGYYFVNEEREFGGTPITKDNYETLFELWLEELSYQELIDILEN